MQVAEIQSPNPRRSPRRQALIAALVAGALLAGPALAGPPPPPPPGHGGSPPPPSRVPPPPDYDPGPPPDDPSVGSAPPPLPVAMRVIYAPFYVAGLVVRYGVYYVLVAPFEVLFRTIDYGAAGGVEHDPDHDHDPS